MKIKVTNKVLDYSNTPIIEFDNKGKEIEVTWRTVIFGACNSFQRDEQLTGDEKQRCYQITKKAYDTNEPDFTVEERAYILERVKKVSAPLVVGRAEELFEEKQV